MKKILAFFTALIMFFITGFGLHCATSQNLKMNNEEFGFWINSYKDASYSAIALNMGKETVPLLGSSEFHHGKRTPYHPSHVFKKSGKDFMIIGSPYTQSLFHATLLGAIEPSMKKREVIMLVSPSWFKAKGVDPRAFAVRFSESEYLAFLSNDNISDDLKSKVAKRTESRLNTYPDMLSRIKRYNNIFIRNTYNPGDLLYFYGRRSFVNESEKITVQTALKLTKIRRYRRWKQETKAKGKYSTKKYWKKLGDKAYIDAKNKAGDNTFFMSDKFYRRKIVPRMAKKAGLSIMDTYAKSPEYEDLKIFLDVAKETGIQVKLVMLPQNGYWYDYTGFPKEGRDAARTKVLKIAEKYQVPVEDLYDESYSPYFFKDTVHPSAKGWIEINEAINKLY